MRQVALVLGGLILVGVAATYLSYGSRAVDPVQMAKTDMKTLERAVTDYCIKKGEYPPTLDVLVGEGAVEPNTLRDPWKQEYRYDPTGRKHKGTRPDIWTVTPGKEVIGNWGQDVK